uniref:Uncharacterized protein n=1 Tax=Entomoneis paludosa TaxID=265537 RepID=A0A7S3DM83_9STRA
MAKVSTHVHETVELCIFVGRGQELIPLGICSFVITGDEEDEVIHNAPVRVPSPGTSTFERHFAPTRKQKRKNWKPCFSNNRLQHYGLDGNANIQLGVRVIPQRTLAAAIQRRENEKAMDDIVFNQVLNDLLGNGQGEIASDGIDAEKAMGKIKGTDTSGTGLMADGLLVDAHDETREGVEEDIDYDREPSKEKASANPYVRQEQRVHGSDSDDMIVDQSGKATQSAPAFSSRFFCGVDLFSDNFTVVGESDNETVEKPKLTVLTDSESMSADPTALLPLSLVSSVSESVTTRGSISHPLFLLPGKS